MVSQSRKGFHSKRRSRTLAVSGGPHGQPHAGHGCPLWPVRSSAWFGGGSALVLATSPRSQGAPAESRRPPTAGTASVPIAPPAHPRAEGYRASPTTRRPGHRTLAVSGGPHGQPHAGHGCPLWPVRSSAWFGGGSALVLATSPRSQGAPAESRRPPTAGTVSVPIAPPAHPRAEGYRASPTTRRAGHRTPGFRRAWKRERRRSGRWKVSPANPCSAESSALTAPRVTLLHPPIPPFWGRRASPWEQSTRNSQ